eukprot:sb/3473452/
MKRKNITPSPLTRYQSTPPNLSISFDANRKYLSIGRSIVDNLHSEVDNLQSKGKEVVRNPRANPKFIKCRHCTSRVNNIIQHDAICPERIVTCSVCDNDIPAKTMVTHQEFCLGSPKRHSTPRGSDNSLDLHNKSPDGLGTPMIYRQRRW